MTNCYKTRKGICKGREFDIALYDTDEEQQLIVVCSSVKELTFWMLDRDPSDEEVRRVGKRINKAIHKQTRIIVKGLRYYVKLVKQ